jgi:hypothetical protein
MQRQTGVMTTCFKQFQSVADTAATDVAIMLPASAAFLFSLQQNWQDSQ